MRAKIFPGPHVTLTLTAKAFSWSQGTRFLGLVTPMIDSKVMGVQVDGKILLAKVREDAPGILKLETKCCCGKRSFRVKASSVRLIQLLRKIQ